MCQRYLFREYRGLSLECWEIITDYNYRSDAFFQPPRLYSQHNSAFSQVSRVKKGRGNLLGKRRGELLTQKHRTTAFIILRFCLHTVAGSPATNVSPDLIGPLQTGTKLLECLNKIKSWPGRNLSWCLSRLLLRLFKASSAALCFPRSVLALHSRSSKRPSGAFQETSYICVP